ncbi:plasma membrane H+-ATPase [Basidiobolus ranarum]|uniref:Plasma membrane H+-ATPase n=1 Tax=Basidiobolus ranarum TaxID=34480 RepID=A0ABR2VM25_9FUNG
MSMSEKTEPVPPNSNNTVQFDSTQQVPARDRHLSIDGNFNPTVPLSKKDTQQSTAAVSVMSDYDWSDEEEIPEEEDEEGHPIDAAVPEELLQTDPQLGLTSAEVEIRKKKYGLNQLSIETENPFVKFLMFFCGPIQYVMWIAVILAGALQDWVDFGVIIGLLALNAFVGFLQEYQAGNIIDQLKKTLALTAVAVRDGRQSEVEANTLVPGDIILVEDGSIIPADARVLGEDSRLQVDQSALTGESLAASKGPGDNLFSSSAIKRGSCYAVVTATALVTLLKLSTVLVLFYSYLSSCGC